ncbi:hypothetical protein JX265_010748 [Neoarthrinium moseri]|uniref:Peptidase M20 dimerisation domain-containing protein n=1 Tax=Neoarthrinium moseri TaxID=1658444 RepID=A0A9P9WE26_9PEZI|nr:uncharacterized protein JN550_007264 [Neoarthrinium moseri]KAI1851665.1 hypothetical protein JX266_003127 [Neoarthrinium moseri]KAI1858655.1 hypothetical protein JX265_010748 [Neoarthrinium moseri]KAI1867212.1 hypothetical protein JN550_007264 [Neoarthrinium moseri]
MGGINGDRLWDDIMFTSQWGGMRGEGREGGMMRLALTDEDRMVRDWFCGRFDGILGVLSGLEVLRSIKESGKKLFCGLTVIDWTNEEGARFSPGCTGAAVWSGHTDIVTAHCRKSNWGNSTTLGEELSRIGYRGRLPAHHQANALSSHFELHIEQGSRLETSGQKIGVVNAIQGIRWFHVSVRGERAHSGATPMTKRADALASASRIVLFVEQLCTKNHAFGTVGSLTVADASPNVISGDVTFSIDLRHPSESILTDLENNIRQEMTSISKGRDGRVVFDMRRIWHSPAREFDPVMLNCIEKAAIYRCGSESQVQRLPSFAGHDSALVALADCPTAMIFVPSKSGISHSPEEWTDKEDCVLGADTLYQAILNYDDYLRRSYRQRSNARESEPEVFVSSL